MKQLILSICMGGLLFASSGCSRLLYGQWKVHQEADPLDDSPIVIIRLLAENKVGLTRPELMVRCEEGFTDVFISHSSFLRHPHDNITVWTRFDRNPARKSSWRVEPNTRRAIVAPIGFGIDSPFATLLAWRSGWVHEIAHEIAHAQKLFVRVISESGRAMDATFQLKGAEKAIRPLRKACGW